MMRSIKSTNLYVLALSLLFVLHISVQAQSVTDGATPLGLTPGMPAGSYPLSDFDAVNLYNGSLGFRLPLLSVGGRGNTGYAMTLRLEQKWVVDKEVTPGEPTMYYPNANWWNLDGFKPNYSMGRLETRQGGSKEFNLQCGLGYIHVWTLTRLTFTAPDGTEYELRDQLTNGQPNHPTCSALNRGRTFVTSDGSSATFISDADVTDYIYDNPANIPQSGYLMLRDGTRYRIDGGKVTWVRDRNGNKLTFTYNTNQKANSITDSLNRQVTITYGSVGGYDEITYKGFGGATRSIKVYLTNLQYALRSDQTLKTYQQLFPELNGAYGVPANVAVIGAVELPNGKQYQFLYNSYAELARVVLPTGGAIEYDYAAGLTNGAASGYFAAVEKNIYRRVIERRVYPDGGSGVNYASRMTYSRPETTTTNAGYVITDQYNSSGTLLTRSYHYFYGSPRLSFNLTPTGYPGWKDGREYQTVEYAADGFTALRQSNYTFAQRAAVNWWTGTADQEPPNDPRVTEMVTTLLDTNQVSKQTFGYDDTVPYNNQNNVKEYDFGSGTPGNLLRETRTTFNTSSTYTDTGVYLISLPAQVSIYNGSGTEQARTTFEYDNYTTDSNHAGLVNRTSISGFDSAFTTSYLTRGNVTGTTRYVLVSGSVTGSISTYSQFDIAANVVKAIDGRGNAINLYYDDCFGAPDGNAQINSAPTQLGGLSSFAFVTRVTNALNQSSFAQFDYYLGKPVDGEDANGIVASGYYSDSLDRPSQVNRAVSTAAANHSVFGYDDTSRIVTITTDLNTNNDGALVSKVIYDQMGRKSEARQYESGTNYIASQIQYDALGRAYKTSNPFRPWQSETAVWTTSAFDALGRVTSVTTPDSAVISTSYLGNAVTVTDQASKVRKSVSDALGRTTSVYEDPSGLNYQTSYSYDTLDNLITVTQGVQTRTFGYDSLKRLTSVTNPESGTINFGYDNNGNLTSRLDARSITTTMAYDVLNRITSKSYNDSPQTPTINYYYDSQTLPGGAPSFDRGFATGRLVAVTYGGTSAGTYRGYDQVGQVLRQYQRTDSVDYLVEASYYANGSVQNVTYPAVPGAGDRRSVSYTNDNAGRTASLSSSATSYAPAASVSSIGYASHNALATQTYGNSLIHAISYNNRLEPSEIKLGTSGAPTSIIDLVYSYGTTNNNGNVQSIAYSGGGLTYSQTFAYDALNRLTTAQENSGTNWSQTNGYDRYGNRWIDLGGGNQSLYFTTSNNRITGSSYDNAGNLLSDGYHSYSYDAENKISKVDGTTAYVYDGAGLRVRKLVGENVRFIYGLSGQLIAEYSGSTGALTKEYIYGQNGLVATIEPAAVNSNGTRYTTPDVLGSPRVLTNSSAGVVSRHDNMPFGEEIGSGIGGRTTGMGFGISDGQRQKFTSHERDAETGLDYMEARYYQGSQGRFTSADSVSGSVLNPQTMNLYAYVINNPLRYIDPTGQMLSDIGIYQTANPEVDRRVARAEDQGVKNWVAGQQNAQGSSGSPIDLRKDKTITGEVKKIKDKAKPLAKGETPVLSDVKAIVGETYNISNGGFIDGYGNEATGFTGTVTPVAYVALDQGGNIIEANGIALAEQVKTEQGEAPQTTKGLAPTPTGGVYIDVQSTKATSPLTVIKQAVFIGQFPPTPNTPATHLFRVGVNEIVKDAKAGTISIKLGPTTKIR
jgi:RHS repeat-associated protein